MLERQIYEFDSFRLNLAEHTLMRDDRAVSLTPKAFEALVVLVQSDGHLVGKDELIQRLWPDTIVEEGNLNNIIYMLRKALGDESNEKKYIETIPKRGYRFVAKVRKVSEQNGDHKADEYALGPSLPASHLASLQQVTTPPAKLYTFLPRLFSERPGMVLLVMSGLTVALTVLLFSVWYSNQQLDTNRTTSPSVKSVAVLPFKVLSTEKDDEYLSMGLADALITKLSNTRQIIVRQTSAITKYEKTDKDPLEAGREQGVEAVIDGQVQRIGDRVRVTVRLVRTSDGTPLWADSFDEQFTHIFTIEDAIAEKVAQSLIQPMASSAKQKQLTKHYTENYEAYQAHLKGRYFLNKRTVSNLQKASAHFQQAIALDQNYALAYVGMAETYTLFSFFTMAAPKDSFPKAKEAANKALAIDNTLAEAYVALGQVKSFYEWDWRGAEEEFQKGIALNPNDPNLHHWRSLNFMAMGRLDDARAAMQRALQLDPLILITNVNLGRIDYYAGRYDKAIEQYQRAIELDANFSRAHLRLGMAYVQIGRHKEALAEYEKSREISGDTPQVEALIAHALAVSGKKSEARAALAKLYERAQQQYVSPYGIALIYTGLGETEQAFAWLEKAYVDRSTEMIYFKVEPSLAPLHSDPRYQDLLHRMGLHQ